MAKFFPRLAVALLIMPSCLIAAGLSPWQFGMTREQVGSFKQFGPYKSFPGGDLETYNREYYGKKENVQFYFVNNRLVKIGVNLGEGLTPQQALPAFKRACSILGKEYGQLESPEFSAPATPGRFDADVSAAIAVTNATIQGKTHVGPKKMPKGMRVWTTVMNAPQLHGLSVTISYEPR